MPWEFWEPKLKANNMHPLAVLYSKKDFDLVRRVKVQAPKVMEGVFHGNNVKYIKWICVEINCKGKASSPAGERLPEYDLDFSNIDGDE